MTEIMKMPQSTVVYFPDGLRDSIKKAAKHEGITMNQWIVRAIASELKKHSKPGEGL